MRNASDIFCLNEDGTDGMQMFSVNGNCPMRIRRRNQTRENDCFEYGRQPTNPDLLNSDLTLGRGDATMSDKPEFSENPNVDECEGSGMNFQEYQNVETQDLPDGDRKKDNDIQFNKINQASGSRERVTTSSISRNPLTGAGMEIKEHKKPKKGLKNLDKWVW